MPTPVKYANDSIRSAYKNVEANAEETLLLTLPADLRPTYEAILHGTDDEDDVYLRDLVKAADKISALIKCIDEAQAGNAEFRTAERSTRSKVDEMAARMLDLGLADGEEDDGHRDDHDSGHDGKEGQVVYMVEARGARTAVEHGGDAEVEDATDGAHARTRESSSRSSTS